MEAKLTGSALGETVPFERTTAPQTSACGIDGRSVDHPQRCTEDMRRKVEDPEQTHDDQKCRNTAFGIQTRHYNWSEHRISRESDVLDGHESIVRIVLLNSFCSTSSEDLIIRSET